jgi:hypothetical protein
MSVKYWASVIMIWFWKYALQFGLHIPRNVENQGNVCVEKDGPDGKGKARDRPVPLLNIGPSVRVGQHNPE